jgi:hypothetical protein
VEPDGRDYAVGLPVAAVPADDLERLGRAGAARRRSASNSYGLSGGSVATMPNQNGSTWVDAQLVMAGNRVSARFRHAAGPASGRQLANQRGNFLEGILVLGGLSTSDICATTPAKADPIYWDKRQLTQRLGRQT